MGLRVAPRARRVAKAACLDRRRLKRKSEFVEVGLLVLAAQAVIDAEAPGLQVGEDAMDGSLMRASSGIFEVCLEGLPVMEHGPEDVDPSASEGDEGLVVAFSFSPFAIVEGAAVGGVQRAEGGLVEDALQGLIAAGRSLEKADFTGLPQHRSKPGRRGQGKIGRAH